MYFIKNISLKYSAEGSGGPSLWQNVAVAL